MLGLLLFLVHCVAGQIRLHQPINLTTQEFSISALVNILTASPSSQNSCAETLISLLTTEIGSANFFNLLLLSGKRINDLGDYHRCKKSESSRYFVMGLHFTDIDFARIGFCLPNNCTVAELSHYKQPTADLLGLIMGRTIEAKNVYVEAVEKVNGGVGFGLTWGLVGLLVVVAVAMTVMEVKGCFAEEKVAGSGVMKAMCCFSFPKNLGEFLKSSRHMDSNFAVFNGIRFLLMAWIMLCNTYSEELLTPSLNRAEWLQMLLTQFKYAFLKSGSVALDALFMISGFFAASTFYLLFSDKAARTPRTFLASYLYHYLRLLPITACAILLMVFVAPALRDFAFSPYLKTVPETCSKSWFLTLLFAGNFQDFENICLNWSWFLMLDMQFYILAPFLVLPFVRSKLLGKFILLALGFASIVTTAIIYAYYNLHISFAKDFDVNYFTVYYIKPYCRIVPYLMGIFLYMMYKDSKTDGSTLEKFSGFIRRGGKYLLWLIGLILMFVSLMLIHFFDNNPKSWGTGLATFHELAFRPLFVIGLILLLYPSLIGYGKFLVSTFGHPILNPFGKLTYSAYMIHFMVLYVTLVHGRVSHFTTETYIFFAFFTTCLLYTSPSPRD
eukprot:TRINITY_DN293_c0_g1_i5.p1 TRINITY_DN293_c0_g1~~TRINITY_DN293_c0_g1_i5.p1  ORF type:complete len:613 (+),score=69.07 TRINITY_DN293_c0_g1_i5:206-2044(+)